MPVPQCFSLSGTAASAPIDVDNTVTETLRSAGGAERKIVPRFIAVHELTAESTNQLPQVHALALVLAFPQVHALAIVLAFPQVHACSSSCP